MLVWNLYQLTNDALSCQLRCSTRRNRSLATVPNVWIRESCRCSTASIAIPCHYTSDNKWMSSSRRLYQQSSRRRVTGCSATSRPREGCNSPPPASLHPLSLDQHTALAI